MGLGILRRGSGGEHDDHSLKKRFGAYFQRAFAYAYANIGDDTSTREVVSRAFCRAFEESPDCSDEQFRMALFGALREDCRSRSRAIPLDIGILAAEREVVTLVFDAGLSTDEADRVLGTDNATMALTSALRKVRALTRPGIPSFFRPA